MTTDDTLIVSYSRRDALADGVLIDVTDAAGEAGFRVPVAFTAAAFAACVETPPGVTGQDEAGRLWDVLTLLRHAARGRAGDESTVLFDVLVVNAGASPRPVRLKAVCGPADDRTPCVTVMLPGED